MITPAANIEEQIGFSKREMVTERMGWTEVPGKGTTLVKA